MSIATPAPPTCYNREEALELSPLVRVLLQEGVPSLLLQVCWVGPGTLGFLLTDSEWFVMLLSVPGSSHHIKIFQLSCSQLAPLAEEKIKSALINVNVMFRYKPLLHKLFPRLFVQLETLSVKHGIQKLRGRNEQIKNFSF